MIIGFDKSSGFVGLPGKCTNHTGTHIIFSGKQSDPVQSVLCLVINRNSGPHDQPDDQGNDGRGRKKQQSQTGADGKCHDQRADHNKRRAQQQAQSQVYAVLYLVDVTGHAGDQCGRTDAVQLTVTQGVDMAEQILAQRRAKTQSRLCGKILGGQAAGQANDSQQNQQRASLPDKHRVGIFNAGVDDAGDHQRNKQLKTCFQHFEKWRQQGLFFVALDVAQQFVHRQTTPLMNILCHNF